jgi:Spy/CpxP family protein refolding chaperone
MHRKAARYVTRTTTAAAGAVATAATSVAAAAVAASIVFSPAADASSRMDGVRADLQRAVQLNQITEEQALSFEAKLAGRILGQA